MREDAIKEFLVSETENGIRDLSRRIAETIERDEAAIKSDMIAAFSALCAEAVRLRNDKEFGDVETISFSFLRTGLADEKAFYRIDANDEHWLLQKAPCFALWEAKSAFEPYFEFARELRRKARSFGRNLREVDAEALILELAAVPQGFVNAFIAKTAGEFGELPSHRALSGARGCAITVGEYRDAQTAVFPSLEESAK
jgi:hypothetical protein